MIDGLNKICAISCCESLLTRRGHFSRAQSWKKRRFLLVQSKNSFFTVYSFPCSCVGMHSVWVPTQDHGNQKKVGCFLFWNTGNKEMRLFGMSKLKELYLYTPSLNPSHVGREVLDRGIGANLRSQFNRNVH